MSHFKFGSIVQGVTSTATAAGTTTLTNISSQIQNFTGTTTQTIVLPDATTMKNGMSFEIYNSSTGALTVNKNGGSLISTVASGIALVVKLTDNSSAAGTWVIQSSASTSGMGGINYITDYDGSAIGSWATYKNTTPSATPETGTGGSPTVTYAVSTSSAIRGTSNFLFTHNAANELGNGFSYAFTINPADKGKVLQISLEYLIASGTYADDDLQFWIYDITNAALIQPAPFKLKNSSLIEKFAMEFQTSSSSTSYRLIAHVATSTATAYTIRFDNWNLGPQAKLYGSPITDWVTATSGAVLKYSTTTATNITSTTTKYRRVGDNYEYQVNVKFNGAANATGNMLLTLADGHTIDTSKIARTSFQVLGHAEGYLNSKVYFGDVRMSNTSTNTLQITRSDDSGAIDTAWIGHTTAGSNVPAGVALTATDEIQYKFSFPASGLSSSVQMSNDADTRVVALYLNKQDAQNLSGSFAQDLITFNSASVVTDTHSSWNTSTNRYYAPVKGIYRASFGLRQGSGTTSTARIYIKKNGTTTYGNTINSALNSNADGTAMFTSAIIELNAGDYLEFYGSKDSSTATGITLSGYTFASIERLSGPSQIAASETVAVRAHRNGSAQTGVNPNNSAVKITLNSVASPGFDSHAAFDTTNNRYIIQTAGKYAVNASIWCQATNVLNNRYILMIYKKGSENIRGQDYVPPAATAFGIVGSGIINCVSGDYIELYLYGVGDNSANTLTISGSAAETAIYITRIGNY